MAIPIIANQYLRNVYFDVLSRWAAKVRRPHFALIGDSITAGGGNWGWRLSGDPLSAVNFGTNGATVKQIAAQHIAALALRPRYLLVEGGVNDSVFGARDPADWGEGFETLQRDADKTGTTVVLTVTPPISDSTVNRQLDVVRRRLKNALPNAICVDLSKQLAPKGTLEPRFTVDGVHFSPAAYDIWAASIGEAIRRNTRCSRTEGSQRG